MIAIYGDIKNTSAKIFLIDIDFLRETDIKQVFTQYELYQFSTVLITSVDTSLIDVLMKKNIKTYLIITEEEESQLDSLTIKQINYITIFNLGGKSKYSHNIPFISKKYNIIDNNDRFIYDEVYIEDAIFLITGNIPQGEYKDLYSINNTDEYCRFLGGNITVNFEIYDKIIIDAIYNNSKINLDKTIHIESYAYFIKLLDLSFDYKNINIVCYNPTYLFKDLCDRFVDSGAILSNYPLKNMKGYIWMRPQELENYIYGISLSRKSKESSKDIYIKGIPEDRVEEDFLTKNSIAIHHGTCHQPIVQFDDKKLNRSLYHIKKVVGVCTFEECYGQNYHIANKDNFSFIPIGYDHALFNKGKINRQTKRPNEKLNIGFVGRAYGTDDEKLLARSELAHPKGYRKGGDILLNIVLRLKLKRINFKITILGQNWEHLTNEFDEYNIEYDYYARDKNISYKDYPEIYANLDILFIAARCEGGPVSAIEALSMGVSVISTDVGVVQYLNKISKNCTTFKFNRKWHTVEYRTATEAITSLSNRKIEYTDRLRIRETVEKHTTEQWVNKILKLAAE